MIKRKESPNRPRSLYAHLFAVQVFVLCGVVALVITFYAADQTQRAMENLGDLWAPALREASAGEATPSDDTVRVYRDIEIQHRDPPATAQTHSQIQVRWRALREALDERGVSVYGMRVSGTTGNTVVWLKVRETPARWIGIRGNLDGEDFRWRFWASVGLSIALIAFASWWLMRKIAAPLKALEHAVLDFSAGKPFQSPTKTGSREVQVLTDTFTRMAKEREDLDAQRALMLAGISHDIRSPLTRIRMAAELIGPSDASLAERIVRNVSIADDLVGSFSDYVRAESESIDEMVNIGPLVREVLHAANLSVDCVRKSNDASVTGNIRLLRRAFANLVDNAIVHGAPPIIVDIEKLEAHALVVIEDAGSGIDEADSERLLRPFERGDRSRTAPGSGLGLAIAARVLQRHGGELRIERAASGGARFVCVLPRRRDAPQ